MAHSPLRLVWLQVGAQTETELKEKKLRVEDALNATKVRLKAVLLSVVAPLSAEPSKSRTMFHLCAPYGHQPLRWQLVLQCLPLSDTRSHQIRQDASIGSKGQPCGSCWAWRCACSSSRASCNAHVMALGGSVRRRERQLCPRRQQWRRAS